MSVTNHSLAELHALHEKNQLRISAVGGLDHPMGRDMMLACFIQEWMFSEVIAGADPVDLVNRMLFSVTNNMVEAAINISNYTGERRDEVFEKFEDCIHANAQHLLMDQDFCEPCTNVTKQ